MCAPILILYRTTANFFDPFPLVGNTTYYPQGYIVVYGTLYSEKNLELTEKQVRLIKEIELAELTLNSLKKNHPTEYGLYLVYKTWKPIKPKEGSK